jgi:general secretion pathway protein J
MCTHSIRTISSGGGDRRKSYSPCVLLEDGRSSCGPSGLSQSLTMKTRDSNVAGFSLLEALIALALTALVLSALGTVTRSWLPNWMHGFNRLQKQEQFAIAFQRVASDLSASEFVPAALNSRDPLFDGRDGGVTFVRSTLGPNSMPGLEITRFAQVREGSSYLLVRSRAPYGPVADHESLQDFSEFTTILHSADRLSFAYGGSDGVWRNSWEHQPRLPIRIRIIGRGPMGTLTTALSVHSAIPLECLSRNSLENCFGPSNLQQDRQHE